MTSDPVAGPTTLDFVVLITAKAPVPGYVKTRLTPPLSPDQAAALAAAALVDTIEAALAAVGGRRSGVVLSMAGQPDSTWPRLAAAMSRCTVIEQVGATFGDRLCQSHERAAQLARGLPVIQIGMDTPQVTAATLAAAAGRLQEGFDAVLGPASDGGWWLLGLRSPMAASVLRQVPMSSTETGRLTREALEALGLVVDELHTETDIDTYDDALRVRLLGHGTHFATAFDELGSTPPH